MKFQNLGEMKFKTSKKKSLGFIVFNDGENDSVSSDIANALYYASDHFL